MTVMLTDDEVAALSVRHGHPWPAALPTIPARSPSALIAAVNRGLRSLSVRGLADEAGDEPAGVGASVAQVLRSTRHVAAMVANAARPDVAAGGGVMASIALGAAQWTVDSFTANGVHAFTESDATGVLDRVMAVANGAFESGVRDARGTDGLALVLSCAESPSRFLVVSHGSVASVEVDRPGEIEAVATVLATSGAVDRATVAAFLGLPG